ncbi:MAG: hypothetical protein AB1696_08325 [Planctomycetota bacterium]
MGLLSVGAGRSDITPNYPVEMRGTFSRRPAERANDRLYAKALWLDDGNDRAALVTCDLICVPRDFTEKCRAALADKIGIESRQFFLIGTHTHTAPWPRPPYTDEIVSNVVEAVVAARDDAKEASVKTARALVYGISFNRRAWQVDGTVSMYFGYQSQDLVLLDGPTDPILGIFIFERAGEPPILLANYSLHPCTAGGGALSADYPAAYEQALREHLGQEVHLQFTNAPCGNVNHCDLSQPSGNQPKGIHRLRVGSILAEHTARIMKDARPIESTPVRAVSKRKIFKCREYTEGELAEARKCDSYDSSTWGGTFLEATKKRRICTCADWGGRRELEVQALRFGQAGLAFMPGEDYVEFAIRIKKESPLYPHTYAVELSGDDISYIPTREAFPKGGYTVYSCRFEPGCGEALTDEALEALKEAAKG